MVGWMFLSVFMMYLSVNLYFIDIHFKTMNDFIKVFSPHLRKWFKCGLIGSKSSILQQYLMFITMKQGSLVRKRSLKTCISLWTKFIKSNLIWNFHRAFIVHQWFQSFSRHGPFSSVLFVCYLQLYWTVVVIFLQLYYCFILLCGTISISLFEPL